MRRIAPTFLVVVLVSLLAVVLGAVAIWQLSEDEARRPAALAGAAPTDRVDLLTRPSIRIDGAVAGDESGLSVAGAGDVNGDGRTDVIVGAPFADNNGNDSGSAYVVFGRAATGTVDLSALGAGGFRMDGSFADHAGSSVAGVGDLNGDGLGDVIVGAPGVGPAALGAAYVVYGRATTSRIQLSLVAPGGFKILGAVLGDHAGSSVAGAGDVNGDERPDVIVGAPDASSNRRFVSGSAFVVFGQTTRGLVDLAALGAGGFQIDGADSHDFAGFSVAGAGDINGDGPADVVVGARGRTNNGVDGGSAYAVFGQATTSTVDLRSLGAGGFRIDGSQDQDQLGSSVAGAGDVNGDGLADVIVGAPRASTHTGVAYAVFGQATTSTVDLGAPATGRFDIAGAAPDDNAGRSVAGVGDLNGDGVPDVFVGAPDADNNGRFDSGSAYAVFGQATTSAVDLGALGAGNVRVDGAAAGDGTGSAVAGAGDVNGDGVPDVIVSAPSADQNGRADSGSTYVVFGARPPWGYVWANKTVAASYTPIPSYQRNSTGALNTIVRTGTGAYTVRFPNLGVAGGTVNVTAYGTGSQTCKVRDWSPAASDLEVRVRCFTAGGVPADSQFTATFAQPMGGSRWGYVWANQPAAASYTPNTLYQDNATGATNTITRLSMGRYEVRLPGVGSPGGAVKVTAYGSPGSESCRAKSWGQSGLDQLVTVQCNNAVGARSDVEFTMTFHTEGGLLGVPTELGAERAYVWANQSTAASYTPSLAFQFNSTGATNTITRSNPGVYTVHLPGLGLPRAGHAQVTSHGSPDATRCKVAGWSASGADELVEVRCFDGAGAPIDDLFVMSFVH